MDARKRILIADDHPLVRQGIRALLDQTPDLAVESEARDAAETLAVLRQNPPDLVLLDLSMPGSSGLDLLRQINEEWPSLPVLILSFHQESDYGHRCLRAGAAGYLAKNAPPERVVEAARRVLGGHRYVSEELAAQLADGAASKSGSSLHKKLSDRELQVLCLIASGKTLSEIATSLGLSPKTISTFRDRLLKKLELKNNMELTRYAIEERLVD